MINITGLNMESWVAFVLLISAAGLTTQFTIPELECGQGEVYNSSASAYYPDYQSAHSRDFLDEKGKKLRTLQEYLDGRASYVTVAMDAGLGIPYGTPLCIPELNMHYGRYVNLEVRDTTPDIFGCGYACVEVAVRTEADSYDRALNRNLLIVLMSEEEED